MSKRIILCVKFVTVQFCAGGALQCLHKHCHCEKSQLNVSVVILTQWWCVYMWPPIPGYLCKWAKNWKYLHACECRQWHCQLVSYSLIWPQRIVFQPGLYISYSDTVTQICLGKKEAQTETQISMQKSLSSTINYLSVSYFFSLFKLISFKNTNNKALYISKPELFLLLSG